MTAVWHRALFFASLAAVLLAAGAGCGSEDPSLAYPRPKAESCTHWLYQNDVKIPVAGAAWKFDREKVEDMRVVRVARGPGEGMYTATIAFRARVGDRTVQVEGGIRYRESEVYPDMLIYEDFTLGSVR